MSTPTASTMAPPSPPAPNVLTKHRPKQPPRNPSFGKRYASVDGLREVPLPLKKEKEKEQDGSREHDEDEWSDLGEPSSSASILPYARPYSQPPLTPTGPPPSHVSDRMSSASLPLPAQIPYHTLPRASIPEEAEVPPAPHPHPPSSFPAPQAAPASVPRPVSLPPTAIARPPSITRQRPSTASSSSSSYPPPEPPTILQPPAPSPTSSVPSSSEPHAPFLATAPPPADSWIQVETTPQEYRLNVRLPGFKRDAITLATKKRRILHVVADSWEKEGGGHFERRISFGYDADLVCVRAEFDGEMLRIIVPRRVPQSGSWS